MTATDGMRYYTGGLNVPRKIPPGRVLDHNHIRHTIRTPHGWRGFRCWTWPKGKVPRNFRRCKCGWSGLPHYAQLRDLYLA
jgi:hypothetical protein